MQFFDSQSKNQTTTTSQPSNSTPVDTQSNSPLQSSYHINTPSVTPVQSLSDRDIKKLIGYNHLTYLLYLLSFITVGLLFIVPVVMTYLKRPDAKGTWLATHFDWQLKTFWYGIFFMVFGVFIMVFSITGLGVSVFAESFSLAFGSVGLFNFGLLMIGFTFLWVLYRIVRGWIALADRRPIPS